MGRPRLAGQTAAARNIFREVLKINKVMTQSPPLLAVLVLKVIVWKDPGNPKNEPLKGQSPCTMRKREEGLSIARLSAGPLLCSVRCLTHTGYLVPTQTAWTPRLLTQHPQVKTVWEGAEHAPAWERSTPILRSQHLPLGAGTPGAVAPSRQPPNSHC